MVKMNMSVLVVLCVVTLSNVQLGQSQCDGEVQHQNTVLQFHCKVCGCKHTVVRINAAVYEALRPILNEMREDIISSVKSEIAKISQRVSNQAEEINAKFSYLNESLRDDFSGVERELSGLNSTANMICDKIEEHDNEITTELMKVNETLTEQIINNSGELKCGGT